MKTNIMRQIDFFLGIPICFFLTGIYKLSKCFSKNNNKNDFKRIVFLKLWGLGSIVLATPAILSTRQKYPNADIYFITFINNVSLLKLLKIIDDKFIISIRNNNFPTLIFDLLKCILKLRRQHIDVLVDMEFFSRASTIISFLTNAKNRVGYYNAHIEGLYRGNMLTHKVYYNHYKNVSVQMLELVNSVGVPPIINELPKVIPATSEILSLWDKLSSINPNINKEKKLIIINPNTGELGAELRKWDPEYFGELINLINERLTDKFGIIFIGSPSEKDYNDYVISFIKNKQNIINFAGHSKIEDIIYLFSIGTIFVTNDSGPMHLAALTDIHIICLFGTETPVLFSPLTNNKTIFYKSVYCSPCLTIYNGKFNTCLFNKRCLRLITPQEVFEAVNDYIESKKL